MALEMVLSLRCTRQSGRKMRRSQVSCTFIQVLVTLALYAHLRFCDALNKSLNLIYDLPGNVFRSLCYHSTAFQATGACVLKKPYGISLNFPQVMSLLII